LQAGASKVYITSRKAAACDAAVKALHALPNLAPGAQAIAVPADSSKFEGVQHLVNEVAKTTDHVDILFANAGATWGEAFDTHPDSAFAKVMDLNVKSVFNTIRLYVSATVAENLIEKKASNESVVLRHYWRRMLRLKTHQGLLLQPLSLVLASVLLVNTRHLDTRRPRLLSFILREIWLLNWALGIS
jgi:NAD(P)-dependent dehydrogenase (short-subunit alcohol dehydrogenase family)